MSSPRNKLTEFAPLSSEIKQQSGSGFLLTRFFKKSKDSSREGSSSHSPSPNTAENRKDVYTVSSTSTSSGNDQREVKKVPDKTQYVPCSAHRRGRSITEDELLERSKSRQVLTGPEVAQTRTAQTVLKRLRSILDHTNQTLKEYDDSDLKQYWMPDSSCKECYDCGDKFTTFRRRHHCRVCGQIFCSRCCNQEVPGKLMGCTGDLRVCTYCCKMVLSYAQSSDSSYDLASLQENMSSLVATIESDSDSYTETSRTPSKKRRSFFWEEDLLKPVGTESFPSVNSLPRLATHPFDITPISEFAKGDQFFQERKALVEDSAQLKELWCQITNPIHGVELQNRRHRLRNYTNCIVGNELVDWLLRNDKASDRYQAGAIGQALMDAKFLECVTTHAQIFSDEYQLYKAGKAAKLDSPTDTCIHGEHVQLEEDQEPTWFKEIQREEEEISRPDAQEKEKDEKSRSRSSLLESRNEQSTSSIDSLESSGATFYLNLDEEKGQAGVSVKKRETKQEKHQILSGKALDVRQTSMGENAIGSMLNTLTSSGTQDDFIKGALSVKSSDTIMSAEKADYWQTGTSALMSEDREVFKLFSAAANYHMVALLKQLLSSECLSLTWSDVIMSLAMRIAETVRPDVKHEGDDMDIRQYVHIKKVPGASKTDTKIIHGIVCSKNVAHKNMMTQITNPKVLLLRSAIEYQRVENKFSSIDPVVMQEKEFLRNSVAKLAGMGPDVILVEKSASRLAQDFILETGMSLVMNVKPSVLSRVARCTQADVVQSIEGQITRPRLGFCHQFGVYPFNIQPHKPDGKVKNLMYFDGCASHLYCTVILRGGSTAELKKVKEILQLMIYVAYHNRLETCFLMDESVMPMAKKFPATSIQSPESENVLQTTAFANSTNMGKKPGHSFTDLLGKTESDEAREEDQSDASMVNKWIDYSVLESDDSLFKTVSSDAEKIKLHADTKTHKLQGKHQRINSGDGLAEMQAEVESNELDNAISLSAEALPPECASEPNLHPITPYQNDDLTNQYVSKRSSGDLGRSTSDGDVLPIEAGASVELQHHRRVGALTCDDSPAAATPTTRQGRAVSIGDIARRTLRIQTLENAVDDDDVAATASPRLAMRSLCEDRALTAALAAVYGASPRAGAPHGSVADNVFCTPMPVARKREPYARQSVAEEGPTEEEEAGDEYTDPLQRYLHSKDESVFKTTDESLTLRTAHHAVDQFRKALDDVVLSVSPNLKYAPPFLETQPGRRCILREYLPVEIYRSQLFGKKDARCRPRLDRDVGNGSEVGGDGGGGSVRYLPSHPFLLERFTAGVSETNVQNLLSDFRARGGTITPVCCACDHECEEEASDCTDVIVPAGFLESASRNDSDRRQEETTWDPRKYDCLNPYNHQKMAVLFNSYSYVSANAPNYCVNPWVVTMDFYGRNDITLGAFLERYCFRQTYLCPSVLCDTPMLDHIRKFSHEEGCVQIDLRKLEQPIPGPGENILMWSWCRKCRQVTPVVPMSRSTWSMSFAKYLELRFHGYQYGCRAEQDVTCTHSLHHDYYQYFGSGEYVASFKYSPILLREICLPPSIITVKEDRIKHNDIIENVKYLAVKGYGVYSAVLERILTLKEAVVGSKYEQTIADYMVKQQIERSEFRRYIEDIQLMLVVPELTTFLDNQADSNPGGLQLFLEILDSITKLKTVIAGAVVFWNARITEFLQAKKLEDKIKSKTNPKLPVVAGRSRDETLSTPAFVSTPNYTGAPVQPSAHKDAEMPSTTLQKQSSGIFVNTTTPISVVPPGGSEINDLSIPELGQTGSDSPYTQKLINNEVSAECQETVDALTKLEIFTQNSCSASCSSAGGVSQNSPVEFSVDPGICAIAQLADGATDKDERFVVCHARDAGVDMLRSHRRCLSDGETQMKQANKWSAEEDQTDSKAERKTGGGATMKTIFTQLISGSGYVPLPLAFPPDEHYLPPDPGSVPVVIYDKESSSIIAYTLTSSEYASQLEHIQVALRQLATPQPSAHGSPTTKRRNQSGDQLSQDGLDILEGPRKSAVLAFFRGKDVERSPKLLRVNKAALNAALDSVQYIPGAESVDEDDVQSQDDFMINSTDKEKALKQGLNLHIELQFSDNAAKFYCRVYFAESFRKLRKLIFPQGEEHYIRSLSRCFTWMARGGKSGSTFCKTQDDRFILKQMSRFEIQSFLEFAPAYFGYIQKAHTEKKPTVLAKILGVYRIGYRNTQNNTASKQDLLVMENLFYDRKVSQIFDLKGSIRNRLASTSGKIEGDLVLLDENLLKMTCDTPLYIRQYSKTVLTMAINSDTHFLSNKMG
ncbi:PREDICTED: 1-phosphatidylinositol 3-phosphate 5-kinase-like [Priapulus caudatus]|uniref:1-phosphatidylinositol-3-phosphate 5-kinase n=1 Tax=Priapulus caudatus TaxID=37621 RepID=A0ABM1EQK4_PRICU|nr:PREDICTED: 1-phosphatidylinositol 3-phosphate 5-kinase-like [Priapulus caudatus]